MILHGEFFSNCLRKVVSFKAILPIETEQEIKGQEASQSLKFKALYLLHGYCGNCNDWLLNSKIKELSAAHNIAVIMPSGDNGFYVDSVTGARYGEFIGKELVEITRRLFPLSEKRADTLIGGLSMGGYGAIRNGLKYADTFGSILALSSALITDAFAESHGEMKGAPENGEYFRAIFGDPEKLQGSENDPKALAKQRKESGMPFPGIYMACGSEDFLIEPNRNLRDFYKKLQIDLTYEEAPGVHDWVFWDSHIRKALDWYENRNLASK
jgi:putative tributyrin esterase